MMKLKADLHLHSVLSPCADLLMTPAEIVKKADKVGIEVIALSDHNSAENAEVFKYYCQKYNINFIPAMETETKEEIHLLCYFPDLKTLFKWQEIIYSKLPAEKNDEDFFGPQLKCEMNDSYLKKIDKFLAAAADISFNECLNKVNALGGIVIPSHLDRKNSIISQLGFIPPDINLKTVEISKNIDSKKLKEKFSHLQGFQFIKNSDSHYLKEIKAYHHLILKKFTFFEFKKAVNKIDGRKIELI